jgi:hypothetical protein
MMSTFKRYVIAFVVCFLVGVGLTLACANVAHADPITNIGDQSYQVTCKVLGQELDGSYADDSRTLVHVALAIAKVYEIAPTTAARVINYQVTTYCPQYWRNLQMVGDIAREGIPS